MILFCTLYTDFHPQKAYSLSFLLALGFPGGSEDKACARNVRVSVRSLGREDPVEKEMATHSSILT